MRTIYAKITPRNWWIDAEICYESDLGIQVQVAHKPFGFGLLRSVLRISNDESPRKKDYHGAVEWVNNYLENAKKYSSDKVVDYKPEILK